LLILSEQGAMRLINMQEIRFAAEEGALIDLTPGVQP